MALLQQILLHGTPQNKMQRIMQMVLQPIMQPLRKVLLLIPHCSQQM
jgi:hypothetical protein